MHFAYSNTQVLNTDATIDLISFMLQTYLPDASRSFAGNIINNCAFGRGCVDGFFCQAVDNVCVPCDIDCKSCFSATKGDCSLGYPNSPDFYKSPAVTTGFFPTSKYNCSDLIYNNQFIYLKPF